MAHICITKTTTVPYDYQQGQPKNYQLDWHRWYPGADVLPGEEHPVEIVLPDDPPTYATEPASGLAIASSLLVAVAGMIMAYQASR